MSAKAIFEADAKRILRDRFAKAEFAAISNSCGLSRPCFAEVDETANFDACLAANPWLQTQKLVAKPDQMIKRRGKLGLLKVNATWDEVQEWIKEKLQATTTVGKASGRLKHFIVEPFIAHKESEEYYIAIYSERNCDTILFTHEGGVDVGDVDSKALTLDVAVNCELDLNKVEEALLKNVPANAKQQLKQFVEALYKAYVDLHFTYLEINPLVVSGGKIYILDLAAKIDQTAEFLVKSDWGNVRFPAPFGRDSYPEEEYVAELDSKGGASLKLTVLNKNGKVWTMVAGGGASVIFADTICQFGYANELANYGEYSGAPTETQTYEYAKTILKLMTDSAVSKDGKVLIIGGSIANFTNVASTFRGIVKALTEYARLLQEHNVSVYVRRGGPNYQEGLRIMRDLGGRINLPIYVFGPETHMTAIVAYALKMREIPTTTVPSSKANFMVDMSSGAGQAAGASSVSTKSEASEADGIKAFSQVSSGPEAMDVDGKKPLFSASTKAIIWGMQHRAVQSMLDYDFACSRQEPSVVCMVYPMVSDHVNPFWWGHKEILIPTYKNFSDAVKKHPGADAVVNFASLRSAYDSTMEMLDFPSITSISIIAEGIPENLTRKLVKKAEQKGTVVIGPATVGGVKPGCFKIGNTGGMLDNILASKLYRPGSVAYVSRSGGMSNELNNIISRRTNGVYEGVAIGGDRYPGSTFFDHIRRYEEDSNVKMIVLLGELGGREEYRIAEAMKNGEIKKPIVAWCIGTCASMFTTDVQFGHAGASANAEQETAVAKNEGLAKAGAIVPKSFDELGDAIQEVYNKLVADGTIIVQPEAPPPTVPMDYNWARELGLIRKPASFMTSISDERGQELLYAGVPITSVMKDDIGVGGVLSLLWFQRPLPKYATKFIEMCLMVTADHGPAVSGAHNTIVTARAGKDLVSSLVSGLLTIGDRFGGAIDGAARAFSEAHDAGLSPHDMVNKWRKEGRLIMGIGHRVKSINNPDKRVDILIQYVKDNFPNHTLLDYALEVQKITTKKKPNLILNIDGLIGTAFCDLLRHSGAFTKEEANEYLEIGILNGLFVLGRSIGFIGHFLDQKRLRQGLYRHPWDDISYIMPEMSGGSSYDNLGSSSVVR